MSASLAAEVSLDGIPEQPWFFSMDTPARYVGGSDPDGEYLLAMVDGPVSLTDERLAEQLTSWAWTIAKLATLHRTIKPELLQQPNELVTAAADLGAADTTPDTST